MLLPSRRDTILLHFAFCILHSAKPVVYPESFTVHCQLSTVNSYEVAYE